MRLSAAKFGHRDAAWECALESDCLEIIAGMSPLTEDELDAMQRRCDAATASPWWAWVEGRDGLSGDTFVGMGGDPQLKDLYLSHGSGEGNVSEADVDFIAHARQDIPALLAEVRRLRSWSAD